MTELASSGADQTDQSDRTGIAASPGYAAGPLHPLDFVVLDYRPKGSVEAEEMALRQAIARASERIADIIEGAPEDSADILEFQLAMLGDDSLSETAFTAIADGVPADAAWSARLDEEIEGYERSPDEYFRARAADLRDIRDQVLRALSEAESGQSPDGAILYGDDIAPTRFLESNWTRGGGVALAKGSAASHVAMLARARGVPMVVGLGHLAVAGGEPALLDGDAGRLTVSPSPAEIADFERRAAASASRLTAAQLHLHRAALTADGTGIAVAINVADPADIEAVVIATCDGVGLMRTEFLFGKGLPDEEAQYLAYRAVLRWASGKPVTIRTVDAGGDKPVRGFTVQETNPFLGLRGIRLALRRQDVFRVQVRALLRAAVDGDLRVMFPMVALASEFDDARRLFAEEARALADQGIGHRLPPLGIMVEVPAVAIAPETVADAAFFSIGSNDLTQYVMAAARDNADVAALSDVRHPAILKLIASVTAFGAARGLPVSLCGDAGGDPDAIPHLLAAGLRSLSVAPAQLAIAKAAIAAIRI